MKPRTGMQEIGVESGQLLEGLEPVTAYQQPVSREEIARLRWTAALLAERLAAGLEPPPGPAQVCARH